MASPQRANTAPPTFAIGFLGARGYSQRAEILAAFEHRAARTTCARVASRSSRSVAARALHCLEARPPLCRGEEIAMIGEAHWLPLAVVLFASLPIVARWLRARREDDNYRVEQGSVRCRARGNQLAHCTVVRDAKTGEPIGIRACSAIAGEICADKSCLPLFKTAPLHR
jgi:hypothetical protein